MDTGENLRKDLFVGWTSKVCSIISLGVGSKLNRPFERFARAYFLKTMIDSYDSLYGIGSQIGESFHLDRAFNRSHNLIRAGCIFRLGARFPVEKFTILASIYNVTSLTLRKIV